MEYLSTTIICLIVAFLTSFSHNLNRLKRVRNFPKLEKKDLEISIEAVGDDCGMPTRVHIKIHEQHLNITMNQFNELKNLITKI